MAVVPDLKTLLIYKEGENSKRVVVDFINDDFLKQYEINEIVSENCPFDVAFDSEIRDTGNGFIIEEFESVKGKFLPQIARTITVEAHSVWEVYGKTFKAEEI